MTEGTQGSGARSGDQTARRPPIGPNWLVLVGLMLGAIAVVLWNWDGSHQYALKTIDSLGGEFEFPMGGAGSPPSRRLTDEQRLLLEGDLSRATRPEQQRALWEAHPENRVYLGNYITTLLAMGSAEESGAIDHVRNELSEARKLEPENARFDYIEAGLLLSAAVEIKSQNAGRDDHGKWQKDYSIEVRDRGQLDEAMDLLRQGLGKPYWRRYSAAMLEEQLAVLGPPRRLVDLIERTAIAASTLLPDLAKFKTLAQASHLYAELLIAEGKTAEAEIYLEAWETLAEQLTEDSFTLIDVLVATAVVKDAERAVPPLYRKLGREADAERMAVAAASIVKPANDWRGQRDLAREPARQTAGQAQNEQLLQERAGILASMLLPALGRWPGAAEYEPGRMLEYTVFAEIVIAVILAALLITMLVSLVLALRWRGFSPSAKPHSPGLTPDVGAMIRIILLGVVLPVALFFVVTRYLPASGHSYSVRVGTHKLAAEFGLLVVALGTLPILLTIGVVRRRCRELGVTVARWHARILSWPLAIVGTVLLVIAWCWPPTPGDSLKTLALVGLGFMAASLGVAIVVGFAQGLAGQRQHAGFYGAVFRALVPVLAIAVILLGIGSRLFVVQAEARLIDRDTLMQDRERVGFTRLENDLVEQLRTEMLARFEGPAIEPGR